MTPTPFCPRCGTPSNGQPFCARCGLQLAAGPRPPAPSKFLDPMANARSCLGCIGLVFVLLVGAVVLLFVMNQ